MVFLQRLKTEGANKKQLYTRRGSNKNISNLRGVGATNYMIQGLRRKIPEVSIEFDRGWS